MVSFREHFLVIIEPLDFNIHKNCMEYSTLGFVIGSRSAEFEGYIIDLVSQYLHIWQKTYQSVFLKDIKSTLSDFVHSTIRKERVSIHTICALSVLAYYIAAIQGKNLYLRYFSILNNKFPLYYTYFGVKDYNCLEIVNKVHDQTKVLQKEDKRTLYFMRSKILFNNKGFNLNIPK